MIALLARRRLKHGKCDNATFVRKKRALSEATFWEAFNFAKTCRFKNETFCYKCGHCCPTHPPKERRAENGFYVVVGGTTCTSWSTLGLQHWWCHDATTVFVVWLAELLRQDPTHVVQECTRSFDVATFTKATSSKYVLNQISFCPTSLGWPSKRSRSYCLLTNKKHIVVNIPMSVQTAEQLLYQQLRTNAKIFFRAPSSMVTAYCERNMREDRQDEPDSMPRKTLSKGSLSRLDEHVTAAVHSNLDFLVVAHNQSRHFMAFDNLVPALTRSSMPWGRSLKSSSLEPVGSDKISIDRPLLPYECLAAMGWAVLLPLEDGRSQRLPAKLSFKAVYCGDGPSDAELRSMAGNGMHCGAIALVLSYVLLATHRSC